MPDTTSSTPARLHQVAHTAQQVEQQVMRSMQSLTRQQNMLKKATQFWGKEVLRLLQTTQQRTRSASSDLEQLARRAANLATQQFLNPAQAPNYAARAIASSRLTNRRTGGSTSQEPEYFARTAQQLSAQLLRTLGHTTNSL